MLHDRENVRAGRTLLKVLVILVAAILAASLVIRLAKGTRCPVPGAVFKLGQVEVEITEAYRPADPDNRLFDSIVIGLRVSKVRDDASFSTRVLVLRDRDSGRLYGPPLAHGTLDGGQKYMAKEVVLIPDGASGKLTEGWPEVSLRDPRLYKQPYTPKKVVFIRDMLSGELTAVGPGALLRDVKLSRETYIAKEVRLIADRGSGKFRVSFPVFAESVWPDVLLSDFRLYTMKEAAEQYPAEWARYVAEDLGPWLSRRSRAKDR